MDAIYVVQTTLWGWWVVVFSGTVVAFVAYGTHADEAANILNIMFASLFGLAWIFRKGCDVCRIKKEEHSLTLGHKIKACCFYQSDSISLLELWGTIAIVFQLMTALILLTLVTTSKHDL